jgi:hypothetical protein
VGGCRFAHRGKPRWYSGSGAVLEAPALVTGLDDIAVMGQPVEECCRHFGVAKDAGPFAKGKISGDNDRGALVKPTETVYRGEQVGQRSAETVQLPYHEAVARPEERQGLRQAGTIPPLPRA